MVFIQFEGRSSYFDNSGELKEQIDSFLTCIGADYKDFFIISNSKLITSFELLDKDSTISLQARLRGGKGGYGAKLKSEGGKKVRPNDNMFSRDTHGRKLVYATIEKDFTEFCKKKKEENEMVTREREQFKAMESTLKEGQPFMKLDRAYNQRMEETERNLLEAIKVGRQKLLEKNKKNETSKEDDMNKEKHMSKEEHEEMNKYEESGEGIENNTEVVEEEDNEEDEQYEGNGEYEKEEVIEEWEECEECEEYGECERSEEADIEANPAKEEEQEESKLQSEGILKIPEPAKRATPLPETNPEPIPNCEPTKHLKPNTVLSTPTTGLFLSAKSKLSSLFRK